ncbi:MAG: urease accessory protein UreD [Pseudomonadota bacterium]
MFDLPFTTMQRTHGDARVALSLRGGGTRLDTLEQAGSAKAFLPRSHTPDPEIVFLNTAGGLTGGDALHYGVSLGGGARATAATQTAERAYRSAGGVAAMRVALEVGRGAELHWLPQETILFDGAALSRETDVSLAADAKVLMIETVVLGRAAMGEHVRALTFSDRRTVRRDGRLAWREPLVINTETLGHQGAAALAGMRAFTTLAWIAPGAEDALARVRAAIADMPHAAASAWEGKLIMRAMAEDAKPLRHLAKRCIEALRGAPVPRVWQV